VKKYIEKKDKFLLNPRLNFEEILDMIN